MDKLKEVIDEMEKVARKAAEYDFEAGINASADHMVYFKKYYDIHYKIADLKSGGE